MITSIFVRELASAIRQSYHYTTEVSAQKLAEQMLAETDSLLEPALTAWVHGEEVPDITAGKYSLYKILTIRGNEDYLEAIRLLSDYHKDPIAGEKRIWRPRRTRR